MGMIFWGIAIGILLQQVAAFLFYCFSNNDDDGEIPIFVAAISPFLLVKVILLIFNSLRNIIYNFQYKIVNVVDAKPQWGWGAKMTLEEMITTYGRNYRIIKTYSVKRKLLNNVILFDSRHIPNNIEKDTLPF